MVALFKFYAMAVLFSHKRQLVLEWLHHQDYTKFIIIEIPVTFAKIGYLLYEIPVGVQLGGPHHIWGGTPPFLPSLWILFGGTP